MTKVVRSVGWTLIVAGSVVLLYVVYLLWFTGLETERAQRDLAEVWQTIVDEPAPDPDDPTEERAPIEVGDAFAALWFERDGEMIVTDDPLYVVEGVTVPALRNGPGHYPETPGPGEDGNFAIAGHRTTYGAPFADIDALQDGDTIHVLDRDGNEWVYDYVEQRIVAPSDVWVVKEADPLEREAPMLTLTTCHPRFSAAQRLIVWAELRSA